MSASVRERLDALKRAGDLATGRFDIPAVQEAQRVVERSQDRLGHGLDATVVALAGATGSGKSTLFNAIVGEKVSATGIRRPTTGTVHACVFGKIDNASELLDWLGASVRHHLDAPDPGLNGLVLLDLPDFDSVQEQNRMTVDRMVNLVDTLVWVTDPQKYADEMLHMEYVRPHAGHADVMLFVLNQIDTLPEADKGACAADFAELLRKDGLSNPEVISLSAKHRINIEGLVTRLEERISEHEAVLRRIAADIDGAASGFPAMPTVANAGLSKKSRKSLVASLADASNVQRVQDAVTLGYQMDASAKTGWPATRWLRKFRIHPLKRLHLGEGQSGKTSIPKADPATKAKASSAVRNAVEELAAPWGSPWVELVRSAVSEDADELSDQLDQVISSTVVSQSKPRWWSWVGSLQWFFFMVMLAGLAWLGALLVVGFFQVPIDLITPEIYGWPLPTLLAIVGGALGFLTAVASRFAARAGGRRRALKVRKSIEQSIDGLAAKHILKPVEAELSVAHELAEALDIAKAS